MGHKSFFGILFILLVVVLLGMYWFVPFDSMDFIIKGGNTNFTTGSSNFSDINSSIQFHKNIRFPSSAISYKIYDCPSNKNKEMLDSFLIVENLTIVSFYPVENNELISITCNEKQRFEEGLFIAGEGGPTRLIQTNLFSVIQKGEISLIRESDCPTPNIALHELFHVLGFKHSENENNIMYPVSKCKQEIGDDMIELINELYLIPQQPDLIIENATAIINGKYLDAQISVRNQGLIISPESKLVISIGDDRIKELKLERIDVGYGRVITLTNLFVFKLSINEIKFEIENELIELDKENNIVVLEANKL